MDKITIARIFVIVFSVLVVFALVFVFIYRFLKTKRIKNQNGKKKPKVIGHRPTPLKLDEVRYHRVPSQFTPLVITPTTPNHFTIPLSRPHLDDTRPNDSFPFTHSPDARNASFLTPAYGSKVASGEPRVMLDSPKLLRAMSEGYGPSSKTASHVPPHGKIECFLKYEREEDCLLVQILGKKGHSLSWLTGISNPYIRVALISSSGDCESVRSSQILNLPARPSCKLDGITEEDLKDCLLKFVVLDFDRFSRSEFVAEVLVPLGGLGDLALGVTICEDLMLQQKVVLAPRGSLLISLCNQSVAQQLQVIIMKADGIPSKSPVSLAGSDLCVKTKLETADACFTKKTKGSRKNSSYVFNEKLVFEATSEQLTEAMLSFEVTRGDSKLRELKLGVVRLGLESSQALEIRHWSEMLTSPQKQIAEWHQLRRF